MVKFNAANSTREIEKTDRADRQIAILIFALALAGYLRGIAPDVLQGDPGEFHFAAWNWGLAHPTGYPLYLLAGGLWQHLLAIVGISPARALNAFSAVLGATAVALLYILMRRWLTGAAILGRMAALLTAVFFAVNPTFFSQNLIAEVYTLHALFIVLIFIFAQNLAQSPNPPISQSPHHPVTLSPCHPTTLSPRHLAPLAFLTGLSLTHHAMTLFLIPGLVIYITLLDRRWLRSPAIWLTGGIAFLTPLLLYLYIPLRSGPGPSPWYHQRLGHGVLTLYDNSWQSFVDYVTGRSISVGFHDVGGALAELGLAGNLWRLHFSWLGLLLIIVGLVSLFWRRNWAVLALTLPYVILQQTFNLFYAIDDILVYYIPLYLMATIWIGFGAHWLAVAGWRGEEVEDGGEVGTGGEETGHDISVGDDVGDDADDDPKALEENPLAPYAMGIMILLLLFWLPWRLMRTYPAQLDQSESITARLMWEELLSAQPPDDAILISNDRNEIVPLFYLQSVETRATGITGLFPLIAPDERFTDVGATVETALRDGGDQPVLLIKEMPGLDVKFELAPQTPPLVQVTGPAANGPPDITIMAEYGPLTLLGYDWDREGDTVQIDLHWRVNGPLDADYTTTVQLYDEAKEKLGQDDRPPGGDYYGTSLWKPGETLVDHHTVTIPADAEPCCLLVGMYAGDDFAQLAEPLNIPFVTRRCEADAKCGE